MTIFHGRGRTFWISTETSSKPRPSDHRKPAFQRLRCIRNFRYNPSTYIYHHGEGRRYVTAAVNAQRTSVAISRSPIRPRRSSPIHDCMRDAKSRIHDEKQVPSGRGVLVPSIGPDGDIVRTIRIFEFDAAGQTRDRAEELRWIWIGPILVDCICTIRSWMCRCLIGGDSR